MPTTAEIKQSIEDRKTEIKDELARLHAAGMALSNGGAVRDSVLMPTPRQQTTRSQSQVSFDLKPKTKAKKTRRTSRGGRITRADQAYALLKEKPRTIPQLAEAMKIEPNYLYRVMPKVKGAVVDDKTKTWSIV